MIIDNARHECLDGVCQLAARVRSEAWSEEEFTLWYRMPVAVAPDHAPDRPDCSPFLTALLLWCLRRDEPLRIDGRVSPRLLDAVPQATDIIRSFWPDLFSPIEVIADAHEPDPRSSVVASFFTRGVDSWYTALTHGDRPYDGPRLTHLIYVPSVDFMYDDAHLARSTEATAAAARSADLTPITVETNLRRHTERFLHWGYYHGAGLASVGLALGLHRVLLPGARSYGQLQPEGSHPLLDPLWSTARTHIVHHGANATRWDKVSYLADIPLALRNLKVCFDANTDGNCGRCPKCLVTMVMLTAAGVGDTDRFDAPLTPGRVARLDVPQSLLEQLHDQVLPAVDDRRLALALRALHVRQPASAIVSATHDALRSARSALTERFSDPAQRPFRRNGSPGAGPEGDPPP